MSQEIDLLTEVRDLLRVMAEPAIAKRDEKLRSALREIAGKSKKNANAIYLMDGSRSQTVIGKTVGIDPGQLSRLIKALEKASLVTCKDKQAKLNISIPGNFFDTEV